jgi:hypothetical protein
MIMNDIRMSDTQLPETDHTPYCPGRDIDRGFDRGFIIEEQRKGLQVASRARGNERKGKGSRDHADGSRARGKGSKGDGSRARGKGSKGNGPEDRARGGARARAHTRACARARTRGARQYEVLHLQHLQEPLAASSADSWLRW